MEEKYLSVSEVEEILNRKKSQIYNLKNDKKIQKYLGHEIRIIKDPERYNEKDVLKIKKYLEKKETQIICFPAHKGGIGKTTSTGEIGVLLAQKGYKVLLLDFDIDQQNLSFDFALDRSTDNFGNLIQFSGKTIYEWISEIKLVDECINETRLENLFIIPGHDGVLEYAYDDNKIEYLKKEIKNLDYFDYIIIDTPPGIGFTTTWALHISTDILIPIVPSIYSIQGLTGTMKNITTFRKQNPKLEFRGIFITRSKKGTDAAKDLLELAGSNTLNFLDIIIPERQAVENARKYGQTVTEFEPKLDVVQEYKKIVEVLING